jgi:hypothetical protein
MYRTRTLLGRASLDDPFLHVVMHGLAIFQRTRFDDLGVASGLQDAHLRDSGFSVRPPF